MKSFNFGGVSSRDYSVYISGEGTFNAPERDVEYIDIPGRNGSIVQDNKRFRNIELTYPAFISNGFEETFEAFKSQMLQFRGYQKLTDEYHPDYYREAVFTGPINPVTGPYNKSGKINITFNCKPQRFLTSGAVPATYYPVEYVEGYTDAYNIKGVEVTPGTVLSLYARYNPNVTIPYTASVVYYHGSAVVRVDAVTVSGNAISYTGVVPSGAQTATITFTAGLYADEATPLRVINDGVVSWYTDGGMVFKNPTLYTSRPVLDIYGAVGDTVRIQQIDPAYSIDIGIGEYDTETYDHVTVDSVIGDCYFDGYVGPVKTFANMNQYITLTQNGALSDDYPVIFPGPETFIQTARIGETSTIEKIVIRPGWWTV